MEDFVKIFIVSCLLGLSSQQSPAGTCPSDGVCSALWETDGDVTIGIVANIHTNSIDQDEHQPCSVFQAQDAELVEVTRWLFEQMYQADYIPGIRLGVKVYDACDRSDIAVTSAVSMLPYLRHSNLTIPKNVDGILGILTSSQAENLLDTLEDTYVPLVSPTATAPSLSKNSHFFRTIPSDELQMKVLYNLIKSLQMKYVAVVYSDDQFGHQGKKEIENLVDDDGGQVCIAATVIINSFDDAFRIVNSLVNLQQNLSQKNLPVLFIGQYIDARVLMIHANAYQAAHRLLWIFADSIGVDTTVFDGYPTIGRNSLSVSPYYNIIQEFRSFWTRKLYTTVISRAPASTYPPYYREFVENLLSCSVTTGSCYSKTEQDIDNAYSQSSYINTVIHSAFAFAKAIKTLHTSECGSTNGFCSKFEQTLKFNYDTKLMDILRSISANYTGLDDLSFMPSSIKNSSGFYFERDGNLGVREKQNIYLIHNAKCQSDCVFEIVGTATSDSIELDYDAITLYLDENSNKVTIGSQLPSIYCVNNCQPCEDKFNPDVHHASIWGENLIVAFVPIHKPGSTAFSCGGMRDRQSIEDAEAMLYGMESFNNNSGPWNGKPLLSGHLGILIFDSCQNSLLAASTLSQWLSGSLKVYDRQGRFFDPKKLIGIQGGLYSQVNLQILYISQREYLVQIGYASSSLELPLNSPEFLRTIPADDIQAQAMIDLVKKLGFNAFSVIYRDDSYGFNGYQQLVLKADEAKLCINRAIAIPQNVNEQQLSDVFATLQDAVETKVVIVFTGADEGEVILATANKKTIRKKFIWIGSEAWGARKNLLAPETGNEALGIITIDFPQETNDNYTAYITSLKPHQNSRNMFFKDWWQNRFQCRLASAAVPNPPNKCADTLTIPPPTDVQTAISALNAIWTMALGLSTAFTKICPRTPLKCGAFIKNENARKIIAEEIRNTKLLRNGHEYNIYNKRGDADLTEELWNVQIANNRRKFVKVAQYTNAGLELLNSTKIRYYNVNGQEIGRPKSTCFQCNCIYRYPDDPLITLNNNITIDGKLHIVSFLPFHRSKHTSEIDAHTIVLAEALKQTVKRTNAKIFGRNILGLLVYDTYADKNIAALQTMLSMEAGRYLRLKNYNTRSDDLVCVLTYGTGTDSKYVNDILNKEIVHLNIGKTVNTTGKSNKYFYNFGYTLEEELSALVAVVNHYGWTDLTLVYGNSEESIYAKNTFAKLANDHGLCAIESYSHETFVSAIQNNYVVSSIVVLFVSDNEVVDILNTAGSGLRSKKFIAWSKLTDALPFLGGNSYKAFLNNTIGVSIDVGLIEADNISTIPNERSNAGESNPWIEENIMEFAKIEKDVQYQIKIMEQAVESFAGALGSLMLAECGRMDLCQSLLQKPGWNTQRLSLFLEKNLTFAKAVQPGKKFIIKHFELQSMHADHFMDKKIGTFDPTSQVITITDPGQSSMFKNIKSQCEGRSCENCKTESTSYPFPGWGIALIIIIIFQAIFIIALIVYILRFLRTKTDQTTNFRKNQTEDSHQMEDMESVYSEPHLDYYAYRQKGYLQPVNHDDLHYDYARQDDEWKNGGVTTQAEDHVAPPENKIKRYFATLDSESDTEMDKEDVPDRIKNKSHNSVSSHITSRNKSPNTDLDSSHVGSPMNAATRDLNVADSDVTEKGVSNPAFEPDKETENPYRMSLDLDENSYQNDSLPKTYTDGGNDYSLHNAGLHGNVNNSHGNPSRKSSVTKLGNPSRDLQQIEDEYSSSDNNTDCSSDSEDESQQNFDKSYNKLNNRNHNENVYSMTLSMKDIESAMKSNGGPDIVQKDESYDDDKNISYSMSPPVKIIDSSKQPIRSPAFVLENDDSISDSSVDV